MQRVIKQLVPSAALAGSSGVSQCRCAQGCRGLAGGVRAAGKTLAQLLGTWFWAQTTAVGCWAAEEPAGTGGGAGCAPASLALQDVLMQPCLFI